MNPDARFRALQVRAEGEEARPAALTLKDLAPGEVIIEVAWSGLNYKDALAVTGRGRILRRFPMVPGIDAAGTVVRSDSPDFRIGDAVLVTGCGLGEERDGGFAEYARVPADAVVPLPDGLDVREAMILGTAGFTAALALYRMERNGQRPEMGPVLVTGAGGGVGGFAVQLYSARGYEVHALTGKPEREDTLRALGATAVLDRHGLEMGERPLEKALWGGAVDTLGGATLAWLTRTVRPWGSIAAIGLAGGHELHTTVMPFILRGVSLLGIHSVHCPPGLRRELWRRLGGEWRPSGLERMLCGALDLDEVVPAAHRMLANELHGRLLVRPGGT